MARKFRSAHNLYDYWGHLEVNFSKQRAPRVIFGSFQEFDSQNDDRYLKLTSEVICFQMFTSGRPLGSYKSSIELKLLAIFRLPLKNHTSVQTLQSSARITTFLAVMAVYSESTAQ